MPKQQKYSQSQMLMAAAGYTAGKAIAKASNKVSDAARAVGKAGGKRLKKAAGIRRLGPQDSVMPKVTAKKKADSKATEANKPANKIKKSVQGMYPFAIINKFTGK